MAIGDYRYRIPGGAGNEPDIALNGQIHFDIFIERCVDEDVWEPIQLGHLTVPIPGVQLEACETAGQALALIEEFIVQYGLAQAHRARRALLDLLPSGTWPEDDVVRVIELP